MGLSSMLIECKYIYPTNIKKSKLSLFVFQALIFVLRQLGNKQTFTRAMLREKLAFNK